MDMRTFWPERELSMSEIWNHIRTRETYDLYGTNHMMCMYLPAFLQVMQATTILEDGTLTMTRVWNEEWSWCSSYTMSRPVFGHGLSTSANYFHWSTSSKPGRTTLWWTTSLLDDGTNPNVPNSSTEFIAVTSYKLILADPWLCILYLQGIITLCA